MKEMRARRPTGRSPPEIPAEAKSAWDAHAAAAQAAWEAKLAAYAAAYPTEAADFRRRVAGNRPADLTGSNLSNWRGTSP